MEDPEIKANLAAVEAHFHNEGLNEIEKACEGYTDDIVWEAPARNLRFVNKQDVIDNYRKMFASVKDVEFRSLQRFATQDRVVDDSNRALQTHRSPFRSATHWIGCRDALRPHFHDARRQDCQGNRIRDLLKLGCDRLDIPGFLLSYRIATTF